MISVKEETKSVSIVNHARQVNYSPPSSHLLPKFWTETILKNARSSSTWGHINSRRKQFSLFCNEAWVKRHWWGSLIADSSSASQPIGWSFPAISYHNMNIVPFWISDNRNIMEKYIGSQFLFGHPDHHANSGNQRNGLYPIGIKNEGEQSLYERFIFFVVLGVSGLLVSVGGFVLSAFAVVNLLEWEKPLLSLFLFCVGLGVLLCGSWLTYWSGVFASVGV